MQTNTESARMGEVTPERFFKIIKDKEPITEQPPNVIYCCQYALGTQSSKQSGISSPVLRVFMGCLILLHTFSTESDSKRNIKLHIFPWREQNLLQGDKKPFEKPVLTAYINSKQREEASILSKASDLVNSLWV